MIDLTATIKPKSDQLNADDLIAGPKTITVTGVKLVAEDQPVAISFHGDDGKPYKPCKSMRREVASWVAASEMVRSCMRLCSSVTHSFASIRTSTSC